MFFYRRVLLRYCNEGNIVGGWFLLLVSEQQEFREAMLTVTPFEESEVETVRGERRAWIR
jgi:hypothetical protein